MIKKIGVILLAVMFLGSMAWTPIFDAVQAADKAVKCECGKDCQCDHCKTGKGECQCKAGAKGCNCKSDGKGGCQCGKDCQCEHCKTGKGTCSCKGDGNGGCSCGKDCKCGHCDADHKGNHGKHSKHGKHGKGCNCASDAKGGCHCGKDCQCEHCKTGKGECTCKGDGKGGCSCGKDCKCGHCDADQKGRHGKHSRHGKHGKGCNCAADGKGECKCGKDCKCEHCRTGADGAKAKPTSDADYAKTMKSKAGDFNVTYTSDPETIAPNKLITWKLKVETADGKAVKDAEVTLAGDMPEHGHGMPTQPRVKNNNDGTYLVEGIKFSMTGWWTMTFTIRAGGKTDSVTFNLQLK